MNGRKRPSWQSYALIIARAASMRSEDPYRQVGAAAFREDHSTISTGFNGAPQGIDIDWANREDRQKYVIHAERNCLNFVEKGECVLLACTTMPCMDCLREIAMKKIHRVIFEEVYLKNGVVSMEEEVRSLALHFGISLEQFPPTQSN